MSLTPDSPDAPLSGQQVERRAQTPAPSGYRVPERTSWLTIAAALTAALAVIVYHTPPAGYEVGPFQGLARRQVAPPPPVAAPARDAYGKSGGVQMSFALPGASLPYPLEVSGDASALSYAWTPVDADSLVGGARPLVGPSVVAPERPGFYRLALVRGEERRVVPGMTVAVMVPFSEKVGTTLNGYHIGTYLAERLGGAHEAPAGFVEVTPERLDLPLTPHLRLRDFLTHDDQDTWPRYAAVNPRLLDKLELVMAEVARIRGEASGATLPMGISSAFRTPLHNRVTRWAANDSRHQYGDAADVTVDADGDGRITAMDGRLVALAVEMVELKHPDLVGGMGLYTSRRYRTPYVHIDARGKKARWRA